MSDFDVFVKPTLKRLCKAQWLAIDEEDRDAIIVLCLPIEESHS